MSGGTINSGSKRSVRQDASPLGSVAQFKLDSALSELSAVKLEIEKLKDLHTEQNRIIVALSSDMTKSTAELVKVKTQNKEILSSINTLVDTFGKFDFDNYYRNYYAPGRDKYHNEVYNRSHTEGGTKKSTK